MTDRRLERIVVLVTAEEKEKLKTAAGEKPLSAYLRERAFSSGAAEDIAVAYRKEASRLTKTEIPEAAATVGPNDPLPARIESFEQRVARHSLRMPKRKAEALARQELDTPPQGS